MWCHVEASLRVSIKELRTNESRPHGLCVTQPITSQLNAWWVRGGEAASAGLEGSAVTAPSSDPSPCRGTSGLIYQRQTWSDGEQGKLLAVSAPTCSSLEGRFHHHLAEGDRSNLMSPPLTNPCSSHVDVWNHTQDSILAAFLSLQGNLETLCDSMMAGNLINLNHLQLYFIYLFILAITWWFYLVLYMLLLLGVKVG